MVKTSIINFNKYNYYGINTAHMSKHSEYISSQKYYNKNETSTGLVVAQNIKNNHLVDVDLVVR